jgi:hypothetical protein
MQPFRLESSELSKTSYRVEKLAQVEFPTFPFLRRELRRELPSDQ